MNCRAYDLSGRACATQFQPNVSLGKIGSVFVDFQFSRETGIPFFFFFFKSNLLIFKCWSQYIKTPCSPNKTYLMAGWFS